MSPADFSRPLEGNPLWPADERQEEAGVTAGQGVTEERAGSATALHTSAVLAALLLAGLAFCALLRFTTSPQEAFEYAPLPQGLRIVLGAGWLSVSAVALLR